MIAELSLAEAFERAKSDVLDMTPADFFDQTREHLISERLTATGFQAGVAWEGGDFALFYATPLKRLKIPRHEWHDLRLSFALAGMATTGNPDAPPPRRMIPTPKHATDLSLYAELILIDANGNFAGVWKATENIWSEDQIRAWVRDVILKAGSRRLSRREQNAELQNVRKNVPSKLDKKIHGMFDALQGQQTAGRPRNPENVLD